MLFKQISVDTNKTTSTVVHCIKPTLCSSRSLTCSLFFLFDALARYFNNWYLFFVALYTPPPHTHMPNYMYNSLEPTEHTLSSSYYYWSHVVYTQPLNLSFKRFLCDNYGDGGFILSTLQSVRCCMCTEKGRMKRLQNRSSGWVIFTFMHCSGTPRFLHLIYAQCLLVWD